MVKSFDDGYVVTVTTITSDGVKNVKKLTEEEYELHRKKEDESHLKTAQAFIFLVLFYYLFILFCVFLILYLFYLVSF
jgi:Trk-type K+ transport system membrane component